MWIVVAAAAAGTISFWMLGDRVSCEYQMETHQDSTGGSETRCAAEEKIGSTGT